MSKEKTEYAVFWGGETPADCASFNTYDDPAGAEEDLQWTVSGGLAERVVSYGPWRVTTPPDVAAAELATARADAQRNADLVTELRRRVDALERHRNLTVTPVGYQGAAQHTYTSACDGFHEPGQCPRAEQPGGPDGDGGGCECGSPTCRRGPAPASADADQ